MYSFITDYFKQKQVFNPFPLHYKANANSQQANLKLHYCNVRTENYSFFMNIILHNAIQNRMHCRYSGLMHTIQGKVEASLRKMTRGCRCNGSPQLSGSKPNTW